MECINEGIMLSSPREVSAGNVHPFSLSPANKNQWSQSSVKMTLIKEKNNNNCCEEIIDLEKTIITYHLEFC